MTHFDPDDETGLGELLSGVFSAAAEDVTPAGDGLSRIQDRITARRSRGWWARPATAFAAAGLTVIAGAGAYALASRIDNHGGTSSIGPANSPTASAGISTAPTVAPTTAVAAPVFPATAMFPYVTATQVTTSTHETWMADPASSARFWLVSDLKYSGTTTSTQLVSRSGRTATVDAYPDGVTVPASLVHLTSYDGVWLVTGATDPKGDLTISAPSAGGSVTSPLTVTGPAYGVDEAVEAAVVQSSTVLGRQTSATFGNGSGAWSATVSYSNAVTAPGELVVTQASAKDGKVAALVAQRLQLTQSPIAALPATFIGTMDRTISRFDTRTGKQTQVIIANTDGVDPVSDGGSIYYLGGGSGSACATSGVSSGRSTWYCGTSVHLYSPTSTDTVVASADPGYVITGYAANGGLAWFEQLANASSASSSTPQGQLVIKAAGATSLVRVPFRSFPPLVDANPSFTADGTQLMVAVQSGTQAHLELYDAATGTDAGAACSCGGVNPQLAGLAESAGNGVPTVTWAQANNGQVEVLTGSQRDQTGTARVDFTVPAANAPLAISVTGAGGILLELEDGTVYTWSPGDKAPAVVTSLAPHSSSATANGAAW